MNAEKANTPTSASAMAVRGENSWRLAGFAAASLILLRSWRSCAPVLRSLGEGGSSPGSREGEVLIGPAAGGEARGVDLAPAEQAVLDHLGDGDEGGPGGGRDLLQ